MDDIDGRTSLADYDARTCEDIRVQLTAWVPRLLGVHVSARAYGRGDIAVLMETVAGAAEVTHLPSDADTVRRELRMAAIRAAAAAADECGRSEVRAELVAVRAGCRRAAVAAGVRIPVNSGVHVHGHAHGMVGQAVQGAAQHLVCRGCGDQLVESEDRVRFACADHVADTQDVLAFVFVRVRQVEGSADRQEQGVQKLLVRWREETQ
ncbi:hypothetical protein [Streptomyces sp. NPDC054865]